MKYIILLLSLLSCNALDSKPNFTHPVFSTENCSGAVWEVHFSPRGGSTDFLNTNIGAANSSVYVQAYSFTSAPIAEALISKRKQGKIVEVILDKSDLTGKGSQIENLVKNGVVVYIDNKHAIAHNKIMIIDNRIVFTGSFNFTNAAESSNAENSIKLADPKLAQIYQTNWNSHKEHSVLHQ
jgi:phosphatidylserine/phosphatidylglycerophosphate/cardiolipin synthase-like enzyme